MKKTTYKVTIITLLSFFLVFPACNIDPEYYSQVVPETFYDSQENVWQRFYRPFTHWRWYVADDKPRFHMQELGTDELCLPTRGSDWYNGGVYQQMHYHEFNYTMGELYNGWYGFAMGVALAWDAIQDIDEFVDFEAMGFEEGTRESMLMQLQTLVAAFYLDGLDFFGGVPLYTTTRSDVLPRSTALETFNFIDSLLIESIPNLPVKTELGAPESGGISRATAAALRAKLYFNANVYIGKDMFTEAAAICKDIIDGKYGEYKLDEDWTNIFGFKNETCPEIIWTVPSENAKLETDAGQFDNMQHYNARNMLGGIDANANNGYALSPSLKPNGELYEHRLGRPFSKFEDTDVRKQQYVYLGDGKYRGMFMMGEQINPLDGGACMGAREYVDEVIVLVDQISYFKRLGTPDYPTVNDLPSKISTAEENSGIRLMKRSPVPTYAERDKRHNPDVPIIRLAEIYYTLAECEMRAGNKTEAAEWINKVRRRYFENGNDPNPVTADNLDKYRMLDEWMIEFLCEGRRRTDLRRWDAYVTEAWWDHQPTNDPNKNLFPISERIMGSNSLLVQNPGY